VSAGSGSKVWRFFGLGPVLWWSVEHAESTPSLSQTGWQRGVVAAARAVDNNRGPVWVVAAGVGAGLGAITTAHSLIVRALLGAIIGIGVAWLVPTLWAVAVAFAGPLKQRDETREYARALEAHARAYVEWARRRELAEDFRWTTMEDGRRLMDARSTGGERYLMGTVSDEDVRWRSNIASIRGQLLEHGASENVAAVLDVQLTALDAKDDGYGDDELGRLGASMFATCQNLHEEVRRRDAPPTPPSPPASEGNQ
jgi:hypothetical protein